MTSAFLLRLSGSTPSIRWIGRVLTYANVVVAFAVLCTACLAVLYVLDKEEQSHSLPDQVGVLLPDQDGQLTLPEAIRKFSGKTAIPLRSGGSLRFSTVWIRIDLPPNSVGGDQQLALESLRAQSAYFWATTRDGTVLESSLDWGSLRNGVAVRLPAKLASDTSIIGRIEPVSINRIRLSLRSDRELRTHEFEFERTGGLLIGSLLMVSFFSLVVALFNRDRTFLLYSAWLLTSLRIAAYNGDWDPYWLSIPLGGEHLQVFLRITYVAHSLITLALFEALFTAELNSQKLRRVVQALQLATIGMFIPALALDASLSIKMLWVFSTANILILFYILVVLAVRSPSRALAWYIGSWFVTLLGSVAQIAFTGGFSSEILKIADSQVAAIASALMLGVTLAQKMNAERLARISAQNSAITALHRFRENYNATPVGIFSTKLDGTVIEHNPTFGVMFGHPGKHGSRIGTNWADLSNAEVLKSLKQMATSERMMDTEMSIDQHDGRRRWFHLRAVRKPDRYEAWIEEITLRKQAEEQLQFLVDHDSLTGLLNRRGFEMHLRKAIALAGERSICLAYVDLDRFKLVNDLFGHAAGDQILRQLSTRMRAVILPPHVAARVGGDEFVVILEGVSLEGARTLCERLRADLSDRAYQYQDKAFSVTASIGVIRVLEGMRSDDALSASDRACTEAKRTGGGTVISYDTSNSELLEYLDEIKLVAGMKERLPVENFFTQLQPIVSLRNAADGLSYEVLIRMRDGSGNVLPPGRFIPAAERNGLMTQIDRWVLRSTLEWLDSQPAHRDHVQFCTLNLSGASLNDEKFLQNTIALIRDHPESTRRICFEITESVALYDLNTTRRFVDRVKACGAKVALDDFGAGYTSFSYLKEIPADLVKIDGNFIRDVNSNRSNFAITRAIVELAHELGMGCVAEWAENAEIVRSLIELHVDYAQGYGLCRPLDRERLLAASNGMMLVRDPATIELLLGQEPALIDRTLGLTLPI